MTCPACGRAGRGECRDCAGPALPGCLALLALPAALLLLGALAGVARGQDDGAALLLARTCVSERGWRTETDDCAAIGAVARYQARARGVSLAGALRALSPRLHGSPCSVSRTWLCTLDPDGGRPAGLGAPWARVVASLGRSRRDAWLATLAEARAIVAGTVPDPCAAEVRAWGSEADVRRRRLAGYGWRDVDCGDTRNRFGVVLRRAP